MLEVHEVVQFSLGFDGVDPLSMLRPRKSQVTTVEILPNKRSQLACYCLIWGICPVYGPTTVGQVTV